MTVTAHLYEIFIRAPRQRVWDALVDERDTTRYFHGTRFESSLEPGAPYVCRIVDADRPATDGVIEVFDPPCSRRVLVERWGHHASVDTMAGLGGAGRRGGQGAHHRRRHAALAVVGDLYEPRDWDGDCGELIGALVRLGVRSHFRPPGPS